MRPWPLQVRIAGWVILGLLGALMTFSGLMKLFNPAAMKEQLDPLNPTLIGTGELIAVALMLIPRTASLGVLAVSGFWGGAIVHHMAENTNYGFQAGLLALTWIGAFLRDWRVLASFFPDELDQISRPTQQASESQTSSTQQDPSPQDMPQAAAEPS